MKKILFFFCSCFIFILIVIAQPPSYPPIIADCRSFESCTVNNNATFPNPGGSPLTGARATVEFRKCSNNSFIGEVVEICVNNDTSRQNCPRTGCEFSCEPNSTDPTGLGWSFTDCNDVLQIGTIECNCPQPTPTPTPTSTPVSTPTPEGGEDPPDPPDPCLGDECCGRGTHTECSEGYCEPDIEICFGEETIDPYTGLRIPRECSTYPGECEPEMCVEVCN